MQIFRKTAPNIGNFTHFEDFSKLIKHQIFKLLSQENGSSKVHETQDSEKYLSEYFTDPKNRRFHMQIFRKIVSKSIDFQSFQDFSNLKKYQILKWLSQANGSTQPHKSQDLERYMSKYFTGQKKMPFFYILKIYQTLLNIDFSHVL